MKDLVFPVSLKDFTAYQAAGISRELTANERGALEAWVPLLNDSYQDGKNGDREALVAGTDKMDKLIASQGADLIIAQFLQSMRWWIIYAWDQGNKSREGAA